jgi:hypothetical protein
MLKVITSPCGFHRYAALFQQSIYYFGHPKIITYIDGADSQIRSDYIKFSLEKDKSKQIYDLIPSTRMFEYYILWGHSRDINVNITHLNAMLCKKYKNIDYYY